MRYFICKLSKASTKSNKTFETFATQSNAVMMSIRYRCNMMQQQTLGVQNVHHRLCCALLIAWWNSECRWDLEASHSIRSTE